MNPVLVMVRNVYGNELIYPANDTAKTFAALIGKKTLDRNDFRLIRLLGFDVEQVRQPVPL